MKTFVLHQKGQRRLGDKEEHLYTFEQTESSINQLIDSLRKFLLEEGKNVRELIEERDVNQLKNNYEVIRRYLGINAGKSQEDTFGFIRVLLRHL